MTTPSKSAIRNKLDNVIDPCSEANGSNLSIVEMGLVDEIQLDGNEVTVDMLLTSPHCMMLPAFVDGVDENGVDRRRDGPSAFGLVGVDDCEEAAGDIRPDRP